MVDFVRFSTPRTKLFLLLPVSSWSRQHGKVCWKFALSFCNREVIFSVCCLKKKDLTDGKLKQQRQWEMEKNKLLNLQEHSKFKCKSEAIRELLNPIYKMCCLPTFKSQFCHRLFHVCTHLYTPLQVIIQFIKEIFEWLWTTKKI